MGTVSETESIRERWALRRFERRAARNYWHMTPWRSCNGTLRGWCWRCFWRDINGTHRRELTKMRERLRPIHECPHLNRRPNPAATAVRDRNPEVCLDCGTGLVGVRRP